MNKKDLPTHLIYLSLFIMALFFGGCTCLKVTDYSEIRPVMEPENFFNGPMTAHGVVKNRSGKVIRYFNADITGSVKEGVITLEEDFIFNDGEKQRRVWKLTRKADGTYSGNAGDVVGEAKGEVAGNSMFLKYVLRIPYGDGDIDVTIDDRMYLTSPDVLVNESKMYKLGFRVGEIILVIVKSRS